MTNPLRSSHHSRRALAVGLAAILALSACSGSDNSTPADDAQATADSQAGAAGSVVANDDTPPPASTEAATLSMPDGTVYSFTLSECRTPENSDLGDSLDGSYAIAGTDANGFAFTASRTGVDNEVTFDGGSLTNESTASVPEDVVAYVVSSGQSALTVSGVSVSGSLPMTATSAAAPHGQDVVATLAVTCVSEITN